MVQTRLPAHGHSLAHLGCPMRVTLLQDVPYHLARQRQNPSRLPLPTCAWGYPRRMTLVAVLAPARRLHTLTGITSSTRCKTSIRHFLFQRLRALLQRVLLALQLVLSPMDTAGMVTEFLATAHRQPTERAITSRNTNRVTMATCTAPDMVCSVPRQPLRLF